MHLCNGNWVLITVNTRLHDVYGYSKLNDNKKKYLKIKGFDWFTYNLYICKIACHPYGRCLFFCFWKFSVLFLNIYLWNKRRTNNIDWIICCIGQCIITFWLFSSEAVTFIWQSIGLNRPIRMNKMNPNNRVHVDEIHRWSNCATVDPWTNYQIITYMHRKQFFFSLS